MKILQQRPQIYFLFLKQSYTAKYSLYFCTTNPRDLGVRRTKRPRTYHAKGLSADDTYGNLLVWHPVGLLRRSCRWNEHLLTAMYCSHLRRLSAQTPCGARWSRLALSFLLLFQSQCTWLCGNSSSWDGLGFSLHASNAGLTSPSVFHWCRVYGCVAPRLRKWRHSTAHRSRGSRRWRGSVDQTLHNAAAKFYWDTTIAINISNRSLVRSSLCQLRSVISINLNHGPSDRGS